ncbi:MAG: ATPase, T2SS/T4P/T4SS family [Thermodesulfobacteriota bacterium]
MSWSGYLEWVKKQKEAFRWSYSKRPIWETKDFAERMIFNLLRTSGLAEQKGYAQTWEAMIQYFRKGLNLIEEMEQKQANNIYENNSSTDVLDTAPDESLNGSTPEQDDLQEQNLHSSSHNKSPQLMMQQGQKHYKAGQYSKALQIFWEVYRQGQRDFVLIKFMIECMEQLEKSQEMVDYMSQVLVENEFSTKEQAQLNYRLGLTYFKLGKYQQSRQAFWKVRRIYPNFPGLESKLQELEKTRNRSRTRYDYLLNRDLISQEDLNQAMESAKKDKKRDLDQILMEDYGISKEELGNSLSAFYDVPFVAFDSSFDPPYEIFEKRRLDPDFLKRYGWVPIAQKGMSLEVLMTNPFDLGKIDEIRFILGTSRIETKVALKQDIDTFIENFFRELEGGKELTDFDQEISSDFEEEQEEAEELEESGGEQDSEVVRLVNALLVEAWKRGASDIHIEPNPASKYCSVRFRVDGTCHEFRKLRYSLSRPLVSRVKIMSRLDIAERRLPQDGKVKLKLPQINKVVEFRVATIPTLENQEDVVLRVLASGTPLPLEKLGLYERNLEKFQEMIYKPYGMILVVGPTGSGKTTSLHSALNYINTVDKKIWTAEDPVEITQEGLRQVQVNPKIGFDFASALRSFLRADPDVVMIGEMRDTETAHIGVEASLTGHLVFSTLHTNSAPETVTRLLDMDLDPFNFSDSLLCVLAQRLVKTLCPKCKEPYTPSQEELDEISAEFGEGLENVVDSGFLDEPLLYSAKGCNQCMGGYKGRLGIHELMINTPDLKRLIKYQKQTEELMQQALSDGMFTLKQDGLLKVIRGITDIHQVRRAAG